MTEEEKAAVAERWARARIVWENEPQCSFADVGVYVGVSKQAARAKAARDGWQKVQNEGHINVAADILADHVMAMRAVVQERKEAKAPQRRSRGKKVEDVIPREDLSKLGRDDQDHPLATNVPALISRDAFQVSVEAKGRVLVKHRTEINGGRNLMYKALKAANEAKTDEQLKTAFLQLKIAKISLESTAILHTIERQAWSLDTRVGDELPKYRDNDF